MLPYLDEFLLNIQTNNYSAETIYNYQRDLKVFEDFLAENNVEFDQCDKLIIQNYKAYLFSRDRQTPIKKESGIKKLASYSANRMLSSIRSYLKYLIEIDYPVPFPPESVKLVKTEKKHPHVADFDEVIKLIEYPSKIEKNPLIALRNRAILEVLFSTGMRISELINLKVNQIDKEGRIFIMGKGKKERFVYLTPRAWEHLKKYLSTRKDNSPYVFIPYRGSNSSDKNKKISPNYIQEKMKQYREVLGINIPISPHGLRHAFATYLAENGASPVAIQILLGHSSLNTTTRYVHASDRYAQKTHQKFHPLKK
ncbi:MAG TPA: hypothetical protein ENL06_00550 [Candidatus Portnoybacteria bacterium]|nr:hypothetical protein [Candidatus Portnoybacteria bacterium]